MGAVLFRGLSAHIDGSISSAHHFVDFTARKNGQAIVSNAHLLLDVVAFFDRAGQGELIVLLNCMTIARKESPSLLSGKPDPPERGNPANRHRAKTARFA